MNAQPDFYLTFDIVSPQQEIRKFKYFGYQVDNLFSWVEMGRMFIPMQGEASTKG